jgi:hypothetical protein
LCGCIVYHHPVSVHGTKVGWERLHPTVKKQDIHISECITTPDKACRLAIRLLLNRPILDSDCIWMLYSELGYFKTVDYKYIQVFYVWGDSVPRRRPTLLICKRHYLYQTLSFEPTTWSENMYRCFLVIEDISKLHSCVHIHSCVLYVKNRKPCL